MVENVFHTNTDVDLTNELMNANQKLEYKTFEPADYKSISYQVNTKKKEKVSFQNPSNDQFKTEIENLKY